MKHKEITIMALILAFIAWLIICICIGIYAMQYEERQRTNTESIIIDYSIG